MKKSTLYIFSELPSSGKSALAKRPAPIINTFYLRIDTVEQALFKVEGEGYRLAYHVASNNLDPGLRVIADSCNSIELMRKEWRNVATSSRAKFVDIEVICTDKTEHKQRIESGGSVWIEITQLEAG